MPDDIAFKTKPEIVVEQVPWAPEAGLPHGVVLMDAGYGASIDLRTGMTALDLNYVAGTQPNTTVLTSGQEPLPPEKLRWRIERDYLELKRSSRRLGSATSKDEDGEASTITRRRQSRQQLLPKHSSRNLPYPEVIDPEAPSLRRHVPNSMATLRRRLIVELAAILSRRRCCAAAKSARSRRNLTQ